MRNKRMKKEVYTYENADVVVIRTSHYTGAEFDCTVRPYDGSSYIHFTLAGVCAYRMADYAYRKWNERNNN